MAASRRALGEGDRDSFDGCRHQGDHAPYDGIFTVAQSERELQLFEDVCSECNDTGDWTEPGFRGRWKDQSVFQLCT